MKKIIQFCLGKLGYEIRKKLNVDPKLIEAVREIEGLYRLLIFTDLPSSDENRLYLMSRLKNISVGEALYIINYLRKSTVIKGDICEFGVAGGRTSALLAYEILNSSKRIWLFDSFKGLSKPSEKDKLKDDILRLGSIEQYQGAMACGEYMVLEELGRIRFPYEKVKIIRGFIERTIHGHDLPEKVCFAFIDFDFYEPISIVLYFLDKVLQRNGFIVVDDYGFLSTGAKTAVDEFIRAKQGRYVFSLPVQAAGKFCIIERID